MAGGGGEGGQERTHEDGGGKVMRWRQTLIACYAAAIPILRAGGRGSTGIDGSRGGGGVGGGGGGRLEGEGGVVEEVEGCSACSADAVAFELEDCSISVVRRHYAKNGASFDVGILCDTGMSEETQCGIAERLMDTAYQRVFL